MELFLTPQQIAALQDAPGQPIPVVNGDNLERYYLVPEPLFRRLEGLALSPGATGPDELRDLIQQGMDSPEVLADKAFDQLRKHAQKLATPRRSS